MAARKTTDDATTTPPTITLADGETLTPATLASLMRDKAGSHQWALGRTDAVDVLSKRVRSVARSIIERLDAEHRSGYTAHAYSAAEADAIVADMRGSGSRTNPGAAADALRKRAAGTAQDAS